MSILNLNTPQGRGPVGKKSAKVWMGVGLLVAVLGIGSTFAANISLNTPAGTTEFGQGVTQTVYCGSGQSTSVTIAPLSAYQNTSKTIVSAEVLATSTTVKYVTGTNGTERSADVSKRVTIAGSTTQTVPRWSSQSEKKGWWLSSYNSSTIISSNPTLSAAVAAGYFFVPEYNTGTFKSGTGSTDLVVVTGNAAAEVSTTVPASFKLGGIKISNIPPECEDVDFVISSYAQTGLAQTFISKDSDVVKEVAAHWTGSNTAPPTASKDRGALVSTTLISATQDSSSLKILFNTGTGGTPLAADSLYKLVVETQEDVLG